MKKLLLGITLLMLFASISIAGPIFIKLNLTVHGDTILWGGVGGAYTDTLVASGGIYWLDSLANFTWADTTFIHSQRRDTGLCVVLDTVILASGNLIISKFPALNIALFNLTNGWEYSFSVNGAGILNFGAVGITDYSQIGINSQSPTNSGRIVGYRWYEGDSIFGYTNSQWTVPSYGITLTGKDTVSKAYFGDSIYIKEMMLTIKTPGTVAGGDSVWIVSKVNPDSSVRCFIPFGTTSISFTINKAWARDTLCVVQQKGGTTVAFRDWHGCLNYGTRKGKAW